MRASRRVLVTAVVVVLGAVTAAVAVAAGPFGPPEPVDPDWRPADLFETDAPLLGVDGSGNALWATFHRASGDDQMAVYERCGTTWNRSLLGSPGNNFTGSGLKVAPNGTAMAVWEADDASGTLTHYSSVRAPGGTWGAPQVIVADDAVDFVQFAMSDSGAAIALWADPSPVGIWASIRPAGGAWGTPEKIADTTLDRAVAMSASGDAVVVYRGPTPGYAWARFRPAGGAWGGEVTVLENSYSNNMLELMAEFDGTGPGGGAWRDFARVNDAIRVNVRGAGLARSLGPDRQGARRRRRSNAAESAAVVRPAQPARARPPPAGRGRGMDAPPDRHELP